jgi:hypothetical protein
MLGVTLTLNSALQKPGMLSLINQVVPGPSGSALHVITVGSPNSSLTAELPPVIYNLE